MKEKTRLYKKWWFWVCVVLIILIATTAIILINNITIETNSKSQMTIEEITDNLKEETKTAKQKTEEAIQEEKKASLAKTIDVSSINLNKKITIGKITYFVDNTWKSNEDLSENSINRYYYPSSNTMLSIMYGINNNFVSDSNIESLLNRYVSNLSYKDFISKNIKEINGHNFGVVRYYINEFETIQYIFSEDNAIYSFCFAQEDALNNECIELIESIISKIEIM